jgi:SAM-dependent methyltransferase
VTEAIVTTSVTQRWRDRWDAQQERYVPDREERFRVVADVVAWANQGNDRPRVVDLGCGPGSLTTRLAAALPGARIVGVDADPVLLALAAEAGVTAVRTDLADPRWPADVPLEGPWDAAVSSTALHWLEVSDLAVLYRTLAERLRPGGVFVDADHRTVAPAALRGLGSYVREARAVRAGVADNEEWTSWWDAVLADPGLSAQVDARSEVSICHDGNTGLSVDDHVRMLREAGFSAASAVWQFGDDFVVAAVR